MPGYRSLSNHLHGTAANHAREAEERQRSGDVSTAAHLLEEALEASARTKPEIPGWLCGRLASIYRTLKRYDDEVLLLERYRESQTSEEARTRFDARLSKARAIADRKRRPETGALATVRQVRDRSKGRRTPARGVVVVTPTFAVSRVEALRAALAVGTPDGNERLRSAMAQLCHEARELDVSMETLVSTLKMTWQETPKPLGLSDEEWRERYAGALVELLAFYFGEERPH